MTRISSRDSSALCAAITARKAFRTHGALKGGRHIGTFGSLPAAWHDSAASACYLVFSYETPIAWYVPDTGWVMPEVRYSQTTSVHQGRVRHAIQGA